MRLRRFPKILLGGILVVTALAILRAQWLSAHQEIDHLGLQQEYYEKTIGIFQEFYATYLRFVHWIVGLSPETWTAAAAIALVFATLLLGLLAVLI